MARPRLPTLYGYLQWALRLIALVVETCALGALVSLLKDGYILAIGFVTIIIGMMFEMVELVALSSASNSIKRTPSLFLAGGDITLMVLGISSATYGVIHYLDWDPNVLDGAEPVSVWAPWYLGFQLASITLHLVCMMMHFIDFCNSYRY